MSFSPEGFASYPEHLDLLSLTRVIPLETLEKYDFQLKHEIGHFLLLTLYAFDSQL